MAEAHNFSNEQIAHYSEAFKYFDKDGSGGITHSELAEVFHSMGQNPSRKELRKMIEEIDSDNTGTVEFDEFLVLMMNHDKKRSNEAAKAFKLLDMDEDGFIDFNDLKKSAAKMGEFVKDKDLRKMIKAADKNGNGKIDYDEFLKMTS